MILTFDENNPYSRQLLMELETQSEITRVNFYNIPDHVVVDHLPSSVKAIALSRSPNITFAVLFPSVEFVFIKGELIAFDDAMFHLQWCSLTPTVPLLPGQITLRHTDRLIINDAVLHVDSLRDAHAHEIVLRLCRESTIVPAIADGVNVLTVHIDYDFGVDTPPGTVHLTSIPDSLTDIRVPENDLSTLSLEMLHSHNQRLRYIDGPNAIQTRLIYFHRRRCDVDHGAPQDFTREDGMRDFYAHRTLVDLTRKFGDVVANQILQNVYGDYYREAKFGTALGGSQRSRSRSRQRQRSGKKKSRRRNSRKKKTPTIN